MNQNEFRIVPKWSLDGVTHRGLVLACHEASMLALFTCASHVRALIREDLAGKFEDFFY
jgi:hypothetical protein